MSDSVRPHRRQPTRLRRPWDSPGKTTGVGCHFFLQYMKRCSTSLVIRKCKSKPQWDITSHWLEWPSSKRLQTINAGEGAEKREHSWAVGGNVNWYSHYGKWFASAAAAKSLQSCPTLCDSIDGSPPGSTVPGILQARTLEWVAISFSNAWKWKVKVKSLSCIQLLAIPWTAAYQAPPSVGFSRQEYWSGVPLPSLMENGMEIT